MKKGRKLTEEHKNKIALAHLGLKPTLEILEKKSNSMKYKWANDMVYREQMSNAHKSINGAWVGDYKEYINLHNWVRNRKGRAEVCLVCGERKNRTSWANLSGKYKKDIQDYVSLCPSCHRYWDRGLMAINLHEWNKRLFFNDDQ